eukprot:398254-Rhodomonas_salina.3
MSQPPLSLSRPLCSQGIPLPAVPCPLPLAPSRLPRRFLRPRTDLAVPSPHLRIAAAMNTPVGRFWTDLGSSNDLDSATGEEMRPS